MVGAGCALDAAARGLDVALIEARDLASGTSSRSSKLVHRGLRYGALIEDLLALIEEDPSLGEPLGGADDYLRVEVRYAAPAEGALHLDDALARRTRISIETFHRGVDTAQEAAELMADVLGWDAGRESQEQPDDEAADEIRRGAPDAYGELSATGNP